MDTNTAPWMSLACCIGCGAALIVAAWAALAFLRGRGGAALPLLSLLLGRDNAQDDSADWRSPAPSARPDLRAIAREHDFDAALQARQSPALPPEQLPTLRPRDGGPTVTESRSRDEDEEFGISESDDGF